MKEFSIPVKITLDCYLSVKASNQDEAYEIAALLIAFVIAIIAIIIKILNV